MSSEAGTANPSTARGMVAFGVSTVGFVWYSVFWSIALVGWRAARKRYRKRPRSPLSSAARSSVPGVSILRPLKGLDTNLYENLESSFLQDYPNFEIILSVADEHDHALPVVRELLKKYANAKARVIIGEEEVGVNPKINNLIRSYREAAHDILWVLDSNVTVDRGTLARAVDILEPVPTASPSPSRRRIGVVHHVPFAFASREGVGSRIEEAFLNTNHAKMYIALNTLAVDSCVMGKSNLFRRSDLERINGSLKRRSNDDSDSEKCGLAAFGRFLAEDNMIAGALWHELDLRHDLSCDVAFNATGNMSLSTYVGRRVRWIRVRKHMVLLATILEPVTESVVLGALTAWNLKSTFGMSPWLFLPVHFVLWLLVDLDVYASLSDSPLPAARRWSFIAAWMARELLAFPIWLLGIVGNEVEWRGRKYKVLRHGEVSKAESRLGLRSWFNLWLGGRKRVHNLDGYEQLEAAPN